jgi:predicted Zn-dependent protease
MSISVLLLSVALGAAVDQAAPAAPARPSGQQAQQTPSTPRQHAPSTDALGQAYFLFLEGQTLADANDPAGASARYRQALELLGESAEIRAELAGLYARQNDMVEARAEAERAVAADETSRAAHRILGLILATEAQRAAPEELPALLPRAIDHLERALANNFDDLAAQITLAEVYHRNGQHDAAIRELRDFLVDRPGYPQATMLLIEVLRAAGRAEEANELIDDLRDGFGRGASPVRRAEQLENEGRWADAAEAWATVVADNPENREYRVRHAAALANGGELAAARERLLEISRDFPEDVSVWYLLAQVELRDGQPDAAEGAALRIGEIDRRDPRGPLALAEVRARRNDHAGVVAALSARVAVASREDIDTGVYAQMAGMLASAFVELGEDTRAVQTLQTARRRAPEDLHVLFSLAATYEQTRAFDEAERTFRELLEADPSHAPGLNYLGYMLAERGRKLEEAVRFITRALEIDADNPAYLDSLGWAFFKQSRFAEALSPLERAASGAPDSSVIQEHLGDLYLRLRRYGDAAAAFDRALQGDRDEIDQDAVRRKRDEARELDGRD